MKRLRDDRGFAGIPFLSYVAGFGIGLGFVFPLYQVNPSYPFATYAILAPAAGLIGTKIFHSVSDRIAKDDSPARQIGGLIAGIVAGILPLLGLCTAAIMTGRKQPDPIKGKSSLVEPANKISEHCPKQFTTITASVDWSAREQTDKAKPAQIIADKNSAVSSRGAA